MLSYVLVVSFIRYVFDYLCAMLVIVMFIMPMMSFSSVVDIIPFVPDPYLYILGL
jgi:hypothetical protein